MCSPVALKAFWPRDFVTLLFLTVPITSGRDNLCGCGGDSSPSGADPPRIPITMSPPSFFNQGAERYAPTGSRCVARIAVLQSRSSRGHRTGQACRKHLHRLLALVLRARNIFGDCPESVDATDRLSNQGLRSVRRKWLTAGMLLQRCWRGANPRRCFEANKERI